MSIILDHQLREKMAHDASAFPISYFQDELALLPNQAGPLHWHPEFEIATAASGPSWTAMHCPMWCSGTTAAIIRRSMR